MSLIYNSHPSKRYTDERVHAAYLWFLLSASELEKYRELKRQQSESTSASQTHHPKFPIVVQRSRTLAEERRKRKREELKQRALEFHWAQQGRIKRLAKGPESFPIDETIKEVKAQYVWWRYKDEFIEQAGLEYSHCIPSELAATLDVCVSHSEKLKRREVCEMVLWGALSPDALQEIEFFEQEIKVAINEAVTTHRIAEQQRRDAETEEAKRADAERVEAEERVRIQSTAQALASQTRFVSNLSDEAQMAALERFFSSINQGSGAIRPSYGTARYRPNDR